MRRAARDRLESGVYPSSAGKSSRNFAVPSSFHLRKPGTRTAAQPEISLGCGFRRKTSSMYAIGYRSGATHLRVQGGRFRGATTMGGEPQAGRKESCGRFADGEPSPAPGPCP